MRTADFDFDLPPTLIAQQPSPQRDQSRLLVLHRDTGRVEHRRFRDVLEFLRVGDVLVLNNSRVIPARLRGVNAHTGGAFEMLLLEENAINDWWVMLKPGKRARVGTQIVLSSRSSRGNKAESSKKSEPPHVGGYDIKAAVIETNDEGHRRLRFDGVRNILDALDEFGEVPLPPYINRQDANKLAQDKDRYQTVFAETAGSVAAPTAGLHFTEGLLEEIRARGVETHFVTLHVGLGTFAPVKAEILAAHTMHEERFEVSDATAHTVNEAKASGRRVIAVGTTTTRVLESAVITMALAGRAGSPLPAAHLQTSDSAHGMTPPTIPPRLIAAGRGRTKIFIQPPYGFKIVDALLTNFHLPCSTLLMLVSAFAAPGRTSGREIILSAYAEAIRERYRFYSYGDAMLIP